MKSWVTNGRFATGIIAVVQFALSSIAIATVGRTAGTYQVSATGAATYTIPIWAPRGPDGLQPQIALAYNSQSGSGYLGVGWSLEGLSSIYRCTQTYAQDPSPAPVTLTMSDVFCMDGKRLRLTGGGSYGDPGSTYQTEVADFSNVTAYGTAGNGPAYFEVQGRDGRTYEYGNGGSSQVIASGTSTSTAWIWYLDKVTDRAGNTMTFSYTTENGLAVPESISWTPSVYGATTYNYTMAFSYGSNSASGSTYGYVAGTPYSNTNLLSQISVTYNGTSVKEYSLGYQQSLTTGREELTQLSECASGCLAPTQFTYQNGAIGVSPTAKTAISGTFTQLKILNDFNGDGFNDLAYCNNSSPNVIYVAFSEQGGGYEPPVNTGIPCNAPLYGDLTGSGGDGILVRNGADWWYYSWNGSNAFSGQDTGLAYDSTASQYLLADVNGDGLPDLVESKVAVDSGLTLYIRLNTTSGSSVSFSSTNSLAFSDPDPNITAALLTSNTDGQYGSLRRLDFNGDGRDDISYERHETLYPKGGEVDIVDTFELISTNAGFTTVHIARGPETGFVPVAFLNFNSDACTDYLLPGTATAENTIFLSGCDGSLPATISFGPVPVIGAMDWNGDGHTDILVQNGNAIGVYLSEVNGLSSLQATSITYNSAEQYFAFDADGDGLDDLAVVPSSGSGTVSYLVHGDAGQPPDLLSSVMDGYGNVVQPTYAAYTKIGDTGLEGAQYPYENYLGPLYVVTQTTFGDPSNPPGGTYTNSYSYRQGWTNLQGRGFAGFGQQTVTDSRNGVYYDFHYNQAFPYTGMSSFDQAYYFVPSFGGSTTYPLYTHTYTDSDSELDSTDYSQRYFPYVQGVTEQDYELGSASNGYLQNLITTAVSSYSYDEYGNTTTIQRSITDNDASSPYVGDSWTETITNTPDVDRKDSGNRVVPGRV